MKKPSIILLIIFCLLGVVAWIWWQQHKKGFIKEKIGNVVRKGTDSLYFIRYDSSAIDEINGNASFYNVAFQSDSLQKQLLQFDTASSEAVYNIHIDEVSVRGANIPALLNNAKVQAKSIEIIRPVIYIISSGKDKKEKTTAYDTLAIYEKILGRYKSISADEIIIKNGHLNFSDKTGHPHTALKDISIQLNNFRVDSTKDYSNIISYFLKDVIAKVKEVYVETNHHFITLADVEYNAPGKFISLKKFQEKDTLQKIIFDINNTSISGISTDAFILRQQIKADEFKTDGGMISLYRKPEAGTGSDRIEIENNFFDEALLNRITIGNTKIILYNRAKPGEEPFILNNVRFNATDIQTVYSGTYIKQLINRSKWFLAADGFSFLSANKIYKYDFGAFDISNINSTIHLGHFHIMPQISEAVFVKNLKFQEDLYNIRLNDIVLTGLDIRTLIDERKLLAESILLQPVINIYNDRTVTPNPASKVGTYPHQQLAGIKFPFISKKVIVKNGAVFYKERGALSRQTGTVFFKNINAAITNVTNIKELISKNNLLILNATGSFMGISNLKTVWELPLNTTNGSFKVKGEASRFNAEFLNPIAEPLGMASIKKGRVDKLEFNMNGDDYVAKGNATLLYDDLKMEVLKKDSSELKKKDLLSFITNALVKNSNADKKNVKPVLMSFKRDTTKSFFNLVWKTIFEGAKETIQKL